MSDKKVGSVWVKPLQMYEVSFKWRFHFTSFTKSVFIWKLVIHLVVTNFLSTLSKKELYFVGQYIEVLIYIRNSGSSQIYVIGYKQFLFVCKLQQLQMKGHCI